ncbi:MAG TPA: hypothetical protein VHC22_18145 [Pirellulales bacterium]|nr:hypothetical protein [Pirellulales bacterium]
MTEGEGVPEEVDEGTGATEGTGVTAETAAAGKHPWVWYFVGGLLVIVAGAGWMAWTAVRQQQAVVSLKVIGAQLRYADELPFASLSPPMSWLNRWLGHDWAASLVQVNLGRSKVSDDDLQCLEKLPGLKFLWLQDTHVGNDGIAHLKSCLHIQELYLANTKVTDDGLASIAGLRKMKFLSLSGCHITDAGLIHLQGMTNLQRLDMPNTGVTPRGVAELQKSLPAVKITYASGRRKSGS